MIPRNLPELLEAFLLLVPRIEAIERKLAEKPADAPAMIFTEKFDHFTRVSPITRAQMDEVFRELMAAKKQAKPAAERMREYRARKRQKDDA